jgi:hypothetical protein
VRTIIRKIRFEMPGRCSIYRYEQAAKMKTSLLYNQDSARWLYASAQAVRLSRQAGADLVDSAPEAPPM